MTETIARYFAAFNAGDTDAMLDCLDDNIAHHVNEGQIPGGQGEIRQVLRPYEPLLQGRADRYGDLFQR